MTQPRFLALTATGATLAMAMALVSPATAHPHHAEPGAPGAGDPYFPLDGNGGYDVGHYDLAIRYDPDRRPVAREGHDRGAGDPGPLALRPRPCWARCPPNPHRRGPRDVVTRRSGAQDHSAPRPEKAPEVHGASDLFGCPGADRKPHTRNFWILRHRRRLRHSRRAAGGRHLVPRQRPSDGQGVLHLPRHRAAGPRGHRQRPPRLEAHRREPGPRGPTTPESDGQLPRNR